MEQLWSSYGDSVDEDTPHIDHGHRLARFYSKTSSVSYCLPLRAAETDDAGRDTAW